MSSEPSLLERIRTLRADADAFLDEKASELSLTTPSVPLHVLRNLLTIRTYGCQCKAADRHEDIEIVAGANVVEALQKQGSFEAGRGAYCYGIKLVIDDALNATGKQLDDAVQFALMMKIGEVSRVKVNVSQEKRQVERTTVIDHTEDGRIRTFIKEQIAI